MIEEPGLPAGRAGLREAGAGTRTGAAEQLKLSHAANAAVRPPKIVSGKPVHVASFAGGRNGLILCLLTFAAGLGHHRGKRSCRGQPAAPLSQSVSRCFCSGT
jgi:hypothetical protein